MSAALALYHLMQKLNFLKEGGNTKLKKHIKEIKQKLIDVRNQLMGIQASKKNPKDDKLEKNLLKNIYNVDDQIDAFFVQMELHKRKRFTKAFFVNRSMSKLAQSIQSFREEIDKFTQEFGKFKIEDTPKEKEREILAEEESEKHAEQASDKPAEGEIGKPAVQASEKPAEGESGKPAEQAGKTPAGGGEREKTAKGKIEKPAEQTSPVDDQPALFTNISAEPDKKHSEPGEVTSDLSDEDSEFIGREDEVKLLIEALLNNRKLCFLVSVVGAAGSGKTTLVRNVYNRAIVTQHFPLRAWINASEELSESGFDDVDQKMKNLMLDILKQVTAIKDEEKLPLDKLEEKVRNFFIRKRFLIVLDDVKAPNIQAKLEQAFANSLNGSRLVSITRDKQIAIPINDKGFKLIELLSLNKEKSWKLFMKKVPKIEGLNDPSKLQMLIQEKCKGLPLTIVALAGLLSTKNPSTWTEQVEHLDFGKDPSKAILSLAYQELPAALKPCLLYLGIFPKEYEIPVRRLYRLWTAEGLVTRAPKDEIPKELFDTSLKGETPEELAESYLNALITRNMIEVARQRLDGSPKTCRMPGILHDTTVFPYATEVGFFNVVKSQNYQPEENVRRIAAYADISNHPLHDRLDNLRSYISFNTRKGDTPAIEVDKFLNLMIRKRGFSLLTVLDLEKVYKPDLSDQAIEKLINLTYLGLRWTFLDSIPESVGNLPNLESLDVKHTNINSLPVSIWNSKKLRHLYMNEIYLNLPSGKPPSSGALSNLLTLWGLIISKKTGKDWLNSLVHLTKLGITFRFKSPQEISPWISKCERLKSLKLRSIDEYSRPSELKLESMKKYDLLSELYLLGKLSQNIKALDLPTNLKMVTLSVSYLEEDPMRTLGQLPHLRILRLFARSYIGKELTCETGKFPELRVLKLWMLENLEKWIVQEGSMPRLKEVEIRRCDRLKEITGCQQLKSLKDLILTNMPTTFAAAIKSTMKEKNLIINKWEFLPLPKHNMKDNLPCTSDARATQKFLRS